MISESCFRKVGRDRLPRTPVRGQIPGCEHAATVPSEARANRDPRPDGALGITRPTFALIVFASVFAAATAAERDDWRTRMQPITPLGYVVRHTSTPIVIDGKPDDAAWASASWTTDFVDIEGDAKPKPRFRTRAKMLWDDNYFYILGELEEPHVWATLTKHDSVIFNDPDFEVFIDPDGDTHAYSEFEINALNTSWDLHLPKPYMDGGPAQNEWEIPGLKTAVHIDGTLNNPADKDRGWTVEIAFPWNVLAEHARHAGAPNEGEQWRLNFSRVEWRITTEDGVYQKIPATPEDNWVWSPQGVIDMHRPEMWGLLRFTRKPVEESVAVEPVAGKAAHDLALEIYYSQRDYFAAHQHWTATLAELGFGMAEKTSPIIQSAKCIPELQTTTDGYVCTVAFKDGDARGVWRIQQDRKLTLESVPASDAEEKK